MEKKVEEIAPSASNVESVPLLLDMLILDKQMPFIRADSVDRKTLDDSVCPSFFHASNILFVFVF